MAEGRTSPLSPLLLSRDREKTDRARKEAFSSSSSFLLWASLDRPSPILLLSGVCARAGIQEGGGKEIPTPATDLPQMLKGLKLLFIGPKEIEEYVYSVPQTF